MSEDRFEERLRETPLNGPAPEVRERVLQRAAGRAGARRRTRAIRFAFAVAAVLVIAVNLVFGQVHQARLAAIVGPQVAVARSDRPMLADAFAERQRLMSSLLEEPTAASGGEERGEAVFPDLQTYRSPDSQRIA